MADIFEDGFLDFSFSPVGEFLIDEITPFSHNVITNTSSDGSIIDYSYTFAQAYVITNSPFDSRASGVISGMESAFSVPVDQSVEFQVKIKLDKQNYQIVGTEFLTGEPSQEGENTGNFTHSVFDYKTEDAEGNFELIYPICSVRNEHVVNYTTRGNISVDKTQIKQLGDTGAAENGEGGQVHLIVESGYTDPSLPIRFRGISGGSGVQVRYDDGANVSGGNYIIIDTTGSAGGSGLAGWTGENVVPSSSPSPHYIYVDQTGPSEDPPTNAQFLGIRGKAVTESSVSEGKQTATVNVETIDDDVVEISVDLSDCVGIGGSSLTNQVIPSSLPTGSIIVGGAHNSISGHFNVISAGSHNKISGNQLNFIGGGSGNDVDWSRFSSSLGGKNNDISGANYSVLLGGENNLIKTGHAHFLGGGVLNKISGSASIISNALVGGTQNKILDSTYSFIGAGATNTIYSNNAVIGGGTTNIASGDSSVVFGGSNNKVLADYGLAAGRYSTVQENHDGAFVLSDSNTSETLSSGANTLTLNFKSGVYVDSDSGIYINGNPVLTGVSGSEGDTLQIVTDRGATTTNNITLASSLPKLFLQDTDGTNQISEISKAGTYLYFYNRDNVSNGGFLFAGDNGTTETEFMRIATDGDVGIGSNNPSAKLDVAGGIKLLDNNYLTWNSSNTRIVGNSNYLQLQVAAIDKVRVTTSGVGVGTTTPHGQLDVFGSQNAETALGDANNYHLHLHNAGDDTDESIGIAFGITSATDAVGASIAHERKGAGSYGDLYFCTRGSVGSNTERMRIDNAGNVGIGTTTPSGALHVSSNSTNVFIQDANSSYPTARALINFNDNGTQGIMGSIGYEADGNLTISQRNPSKYIALTGSNVGIGTNNPQRELEIHGAGNVFARITASTDNDSAALELNNNGNAIWTLKADDTDSDSFKITHDSAGTALTIDTSKNVGIGTNSPARKLEVSESSSSIVSQFKSTAGTSAFITVANTTASADQIRFGSIGNDLVLSTNYTERFRIDSAGNVGIGVANPPHKLSVKGTISRLNSHNIQVVNLGVSTEHGQVLVNNSGGSPKALIDSNGVSYLNGGNVGIGITAPSGNLHIQPSAVAGYVSDTYADLITESNDSRIQVVSDNGGNNGSALILTNVDAGTHSNWAFGQATTAQGNKLHIGHNTAAGGDVSAYTTTQDLTLTTDGKVGIGSFSPSFVLDTVFAGDNGARLRSTDNHSSLTVQSHASYGAYLRFSDGGNRYWLQARSDDKLQFRPNATLLESACIYFDETGRVGVGVSNPTEKLEVNPDTDVSAIIGKAHVGYIGTSDHAGFSHVDFATSSNYALRQNSVGNTFLNCKTAGTIGFNINNSTIAAFDNGGDFQVDTDTLFVDASADRVGINDSTPSHALDVNGIIRTQGDNKGGGLLGTQFTNIPCTTIDGFFASTSTEDYGYQNALVLNDLAGFTKWAGVTIATSGLYKTRGGSAGSYTYSNEAGTGDFDRAFQANNHTVGSWYTDSGPDGDITTGAANSGSVELYFNGVKSLNYSAQAAVIFGSNAFRATHVKIEALRTGGWQTIVDTTGNDKTAIIARIAGNAGGADATTGLRYTFAKAGNYFRINNFYAADYDLGNDLSYGGQYYIDKYYDGRHYADLRPVTDGGANLGTSSVRYGNSYIDYGRFTNNVGIGTDTLTYNLNVVSNSDILAHFKSNDNKASILLQDDDTAAYVSVENNILALGPQNGTHAAQNLNYNVTNYRLGIGTNVPDLPLHVKGTGIRLEESGAARHLDILPASAGINHKFTSDSTSAGYEFHNNAGNICSFGQTSTIFNQTVSVVSSNIHLNSSHYVRFGSDSYRIQGSNGSNYLRLYGGGNVAVNIDGSANVGIGTTAPSTMLHVEGTGTFHSVDITGASTLTVSGNAGIGTSSPNARLHVNGPSAGFAEALRLQRAGGNYYSVGLDNSRVNFAYNSQTAANSTLVIDGPNTRVGIGTHAPAFELDVDGTIHGTSGNFENGISISGNPVVTGTSAFESDTLQTVTDQGNITSNDIGAGTITGNTLVITGVNSTFKAFEQANDDFRIGTDTADDISIMTNGNRRLTVTDAGNVGIGKTDPNRNFNVVGQIGIDNSASSPSAGMLITLDANSNKIYSRTANNVASAHPLDFFAGSTPTLRIASDGNVGIGTTDPSSLNSAANNLVVGDGAGNHGISIFAGNSNTSSLYLADGTAGDQAYRGYITYSHAAEKLSLGAGGQTRITATNAGLVGINQTNPTSRLDVKLGDGTSAEMNSTGVNNLLTLRVGNNEDPASVANAGAKWGMRLRGFINDTSNPNRKTAAVYAVSEDAGAGYNRKVGMALHTSPFDADHVERVRIDCDGLVGIATGDPQSRLHVYGDAVNNASHADYGIAAFENVNREGLSIGYDADDNYTYLYSREVGVASRGLRLNGSIYVDDLGGDVGIGTTGPSAKLHVAGGNILVDSQYGIRFNDANTRIYTNAETPEDLIVEADQDLHLDPDGVVKVDTAEFQITSSAAFTTHLNYQNLGNNYISQANGGGTFFRNSAGTLMSLNSAGTLNVGAAGVTNTRLHVTGAVSNSLAKFKEGSDGIELTTRTSNGRQQIDFLGTNTSSINAKGSLFINYDTNNDGSNDNIVFARNGADEAGTVDMVIKEGNVGIGTNSPSQKLEIIADATALADQPAEPLFVHNDGNNIDGRVFLSVKHDRISTAQALGAGLKMTAGAVTAGTASYFDSLIFLEGAAAGSDTIHSAPKAIKFYVDNHGTAAGDGTDYSQLGDLRLTIAEDGNIGIGDATPIGDLQIGTNVFSGANGVHADDRIGLSVNGSLKSMVYASTYNNATYPDYGMVFIHGPNTGDYNVWSISPDGPAKGSGLNFIYRKDTSNIHTATPKVVFDGNGNVGIGTTDPAELLHVEGSNATVNVVENGAATVKLRAGSVGRVGTYSNHDFSIVSNSTDQVRIKSDGSVGIGTANPSDILEVVPSDTYGGITVKGNVVPRVVFNSTNGGGNHWGVGAHDNNGNAFAIGHNGAGHAAMDDYVVVKSGGFVGINDLTPTNVFSVSGHATNQTAVAKITRQQASASNNTYTFEVDSSAHTSNMTLGGAMAVDVNAGRAFTINGFGRVGVGTTNPAAFLDVSKDNSNAGNQFVVADTEGTTAGIRTYTVSDPAGLILNHYYAEAGSSNEYARYTDIVSNISNGAGSKIRFITKNAANTYFTSIIDNSGRFGIGTTSPVSKVHIENTAYDFDSSPAATDFHLMLRDLDSSVAGDAISIGFAQSTDATTVGAKLSFLTEDSYSRGGLVFSTNSTADVGDNTAERMRIASDGKVGIGTIDPADTLQVAGQVRIDGSTTDGLTITSNAGASQGLLLFNNSNTDTASIINYYDGPLVLGQNNTEVMRIHDNGNVGIGTTSPARHLHINGGGTNVLANFESTDAGAYLSFSDNSTTNDTSVRLGANGNDFQFFAGGSERVRITSAGNVGIGTTSPSNALDVVGHFSATTKAFLIDHPTKENKKLQYGSLEGPENGVYVRGTTDEETIELPEYWSELVHDESITVVLTPIGKKQDLFIIKKSNKLIKIGGVEGSYDYVVYGERKDIDRLEVEPDGN